MLRSLIALAVLAAAPLAAADEPAPAPSEIVAAAPQADWTQIAPADLLVMELAPDARGRERRVVIQLMPVPFSQGWIGNIRKLAAARWWDGLAVTRVQDNYVAQWGDPDGEDKAKARKLPAGLAVMAERDYAVELGELVLADLPDLVKGFYFTDGKGGPSRLFARSVVNLEDAYAPVTLFKDGWPVGLEKDRPQAGWRTRVWPVHCYGMVGVGRNYSPDTGSGAELYTVIGHAPRHLDRNIALVGRVIEGIEHLSSLPRGHGPLGTYDRAQGDELVPIRSVRLGTEVAGLPSYEFLSTESASFAAYADARANRRDPFFIHPAGGADICNVPVPVRRAGK